VERDQKCKGFADCLELSNTCDNCFTGSRDCEGTFLLIRQLKTWLSHFLPIHFSDLVCRQSGVCVGPLIDDFDEKDEITCKSKCRENDLCGWYTFDERNLKCKRFIDCLETTDEFCTTCTTSQKQCGRKPGKQNTSCCVKD